MGWKGWMETDPRRGESQVSLPFSIFSRERKESRGERLGHQTRAASAAEARARAWLADRLAGTLAGRGFLFGAAIGARLGLAHPSRSGQTTPTEQTHKPGHRPLRTSQPACLPACQLDTGSSFTNDLLRTLTNGIHAVGDHSIGNSTNHQSIASFRSHRRTTPDKKVRMLVCKTEGHSAMRAPATVQPRFEPTA